MNTVIAFPSKRETRARLAPRARRAELAGPKIVILPVVRIERHIEQPMDAGQREPLRLDLSRLPCGLGPAGRRH